MRLYLKKNIDDLNRGWNYNRATHFIFDVGTSMIPSGGVSSLLKGTAARVVSIVLSDGRLVRHVTKQSVNSGFDKYLMNLAKANGGALDYGSHTIDRYGTLESVYNTMYWSTVGEFIDYHMKILFFKHVIFPYYIDNNP